MKFGVIASTAIVVVVAAASFVAGVATAGLRHWFQPIAHVRITNDTTETLKSLRFVFESGGIESTAKLPGLAPGKTTEIRFFVAGEGGYSIEAELANGQTIKGGAGYVESGYSATESITEEWIKPTTKK